jgi:hypothetical protein
MNNNSNLIHRLFKSLRTHIQVKIILIKITSRICSTNILYSIVSNSAQAWCRRGVNQ